MIKSIFLAVFASFATMGVGEQMGEPHEILNELQIQTGENPELLNLLIKILVPVTTGLITNWINKRKEKKKDDEKMVQ